MYRTGINSKVKFEQGYMHKEYLFHLFSVFKLFIFQDKPLARYELRGARKGEIKSYEFKTFTHTLFNPVYELFYGNGKKHITPGIVAKYLTPLGLAHWIMDDGNLNHFRSMVLHTQGFLPAEVEILCAELNLKFGLHCKVVLTRKGSKSRGVI